MTLRTAEYLRTRAIAGHGDAADRPILAALVLNAILAGISLFRRRRIRIDARRIGLAIVYGSAPARRARCGAALLFLVRGAPRRPASFCDRVPGQARTAADALAPSSCCDFNFVAALVSVFALGYASHDAEPERALPVYPAFLAR